MPINRKTNYGQVKITDDAIALLVGTTVSQCYGVVGVTSSSRVKDGINVLLRKEKYAKGVLVAYKNDALIIDLYIILSYGVKISEVVYEAQKRIKYTVENTLNIDVSEINVHIKGIRVG